MVYEKEFAPGGYEGAGAMPIEIRQDIPGWFEKYAIIGGPSAATIAAIEAARAEQAAITEEQWQDILGGAGAGEPMLPGMPAPGEIIGNGIITHMEMPQLSYTTVQPESIPYTPEIWGPGVTPGGEMSGITQRDNSILGILALLLFL